MCGIIRVYFQYKMQRRVNWYSFHIC